MATHSPDQEYEVQQFHEGESYKLLSKFCRKPEVHEDFIAVDQFGPHHLDDQNETLLNFITCLIDQTAHITVEDRNCGSYGTGFVHKVGELYTNKPCPYKACKEPNNNNNNNNNNSSSSREWAIVEVATAWHVVKERGKNSNISVTFFFDNEDETRKRTLEVVNVHSEDEDKDWCLLKCITHDAELIHSLRERNKQLWRDGKQLRKDYGNKEENLVIIVSHPHGGPKKISLGRVKERIKWKEVREEQEWCRYEYQIATCHGSSGAFVYVLGMWRDGCGYWFGHPHCHCAHGKSSVGTESK